MNASFLLLLLTLPFITQSDYHRAMPVPDVSLCGLVSSADRYDKQMVITEGLMSPGEHSVVIYSPQCSPAENHDVAVQVSFEEGWDKSTQGKNLAKLFRKHKTANVKAEGVFWASGGPYGFDAARFRFVVNHVLAAK